MFVTSASVLLLSVMRIMIVKIVRILNVEINTTFKKVLEVDNTAQLQFYVKTERRAHLHCNETIQNDR